MATGPRGDLLKGFRTLFEAGAISGLSDAELLERSSDRGAATAELAFAALVERHGPMVLRVCRKALGDPHDAHDAFQSTFLVLARRADSIRDRRSVASWLHGVALRVASGRRAAESRRRRHERRWAEGAATAVADGGPDDLGAVLHEEVGRLPARYRSAVVLCYLEGRSCEEAAGHLRLPVGTVKSRLSWARQRLRDRLVRRGLGPAAGAVATMLAAEAAHAAVPVPSSWVEATAAEAQRFAAGALGTVPGASAALAQGVIDVMRMHKIKVATAALAGLIVTGAALMAQQAPQAERPREADRLRSMEEKLDRLISVMERQAERHAPAVATTLPPLAEPTLPPPPEPTLAPARASSADGAPRPTPTRAGISPNRLAAIEQRLARLEARLDALERRTGNGGPQALPPKDAAPVGAAADLSPASSFPSTDVAPASNATTSSDVAAPIDPIPTRARPRQ